MANLFLFSLLVAASCVSGSLVKSANKNSSTFELLILHNNDMHARFEQTSQLSGACTTADRDAGKCYGGFPRVAHVVKEARRAASVGEGPPVLYLNAGDTYTGTAWFTIYKWKIAAEFINALRPDAVSLGNHELDESEEGLIPFIRNVSTPVLAANLILENVPELKAERNLKKSIVITINGIKIGIIGYLTPDTKFLAPKNNIEYEDEVSAIQREVEKLKTDNVNILIALGHSGYIADLRIAKEVEDIDLVIGGHSNTFLFNGKTSEKPEFTQGPYPAMVKQASGRMVPVVQAYAFTKYMGKLHLIFDSNGEIIKFDGNPILLDYDVPRDTEVAEIVKRYHDDMERINSEVAGSSLELLDGDCRLRQCNMGNLITDAILEYTKQQEICAGIAIVQGGRIRASIQHDEQPIQLTKGDWYSVLPFSDPLSVMTVNGSVLLRALEHSVDTWRIIDSTGQFLQFSGMQVIYDLARPPGSRIVSAKAISVIDDTTCEETPLIEIKDDILYKIILPGFLAEGGDGYYGFVGLPQEILSYSELPPVFSYLTKHSPINPSISDRLVLLNEDNVQIDVMATVDQIIQKLLPSRANCIITSFKLLFLVNVSLLIHLL